MLNSQWVKGWYSSGLNWRHKDQINVRPAPSTESKLSQQGLAGGSDEPQCTCKWSCMFLRMQTRQAKANISAWVMLKRIFQSALKPVSKFIALFQGEGKFFPDVSGVRQQLFRGSNSCCFQREKKCYLDISFFFFFFSLAHNNSVCI